MSLVGLELGRPGRARWPGIAISLALDLTTSLFSFLFQINTHLNPTGKILGGVVITSVNIFLFFCELSSASIASFHLFQFERFLHSAMDFGYGSLRIFSAMMVEKHELTIVDEDITISDTTILPIELHGPITR
jgi:hypothetical protein